MADACGGLAAIGKVIYNLIKILWILIPIALIALGVFDLGKAVISSDEKEVKAAQKTLINRFIYAALVFFIPIIVTAIMNLIAVDGSGDTTSWKNCWNEIQN